MLNLSKTQLTWHSTVSYNVCKRSETKKDNLYFNLNPSANILLFIHVRKSSDIFKKCKKNLYINASVSLFIFFAFILTVFHTLSASRIPQHVRTKTLLTVWTLFCVFTSLPRNLSAVFSLYKCSGRSKLDLETADRLTLTLTVFQQQSFAFIQHVERADIFDLTGPVFVIGLPRDSFFIYGIIHAYLSLNFLNQTLRSPVLR